MRLAQFVSARLSLRAVVWISLVAAILIALAEPYAFLFLTPPTPVVLLSALAVYLHRRRWADGLMFAIPLILAEEVERGFGAPLLGTLALPILILTGRACLAMVLASSCLGLLMAGVYLKDTFAGSPLTWHDFKFFFLRFQDNVGVMATQPTLVMFAGAILGAIGTAVWAAWCWDQRSNAKPVTTSARLCSALLALSAIVWSTQQMQREVEKVVASGIWNIAVPLDATIAPLSRFAAMISSQPAWQPKPTSTAEFVRFAGNAAARSGPLHSPADIVVILQESQFNPATIAGCPPELCRLAIFDPADSIVAQGPLRVHVFGGGTWLSEFALATGVPHTAFGTAGGFAPFNIAPGVRRSFVLSLKAAGYRTVAIYATRGGMMNGRAAYRSYGFDAFYGAEDLGLSGAFDTPDHVIHAAARRVLAQERAQGAPVFLFVQTIFNHAEHGIGLQRVPETLLRKAHASFAARREAESVADYVWRTQEFAREMAVTRAAVLNSGRPAVLAWFGDHQPPFGSALALRSRIRSFAGTAGRFPPKFQTWYQVQSNMGSPPRIGAERQVLDIVFLPGLLAQAAGIRFDDWIASNVAARQGCDGLLEECTRPEIRDAYLTHLMSDLHAFELP